MFLSDHLNVQVTLKMTLDELKWAYKISMKKSSKEYLLPDVLFRKWIHYAKAAHCDRELSRLTVLGAIHKQCPIKLQISNPCPIIVQTLSKIIKPLPYPWTSENIVNLSFRKKSHLISILQVSFKRKCDDRYLFFLKPLPSLYFVSVLYPFLKTLPPSILEHPLCIRFLKKHHNLRQH